MGESIHANRGAALLHRISKGMFRLSATCNDSTYPGSTASSFLLLLLARASLCVVLLSE